MHDLPETLLENHFKIHLNPPLNKESVQLVSPIPVRSGWRHPLRRARRPRALLLGHNARPGVQVNSGLSFQSPSPLGLLWKVQRFLRSSRKTQDCSVVSLGPNSRSISRVLAWPCGCAWKAMKLRISKSSSSCSVAGGAPRVVCWKLPSAGSSLCWDPVRWFLALILASKEDESKALEESSPAPASPSKREAPGACCSPPLSLSPSCRNTKKKRREEFSYHRT